MGTPLMTQHLAGLWLKARTQPPPQGLAQFSLDACAASAKARIVIGECH